MTVSQILPGSWLGVLGGGQLGRMFTFQAQRLGYHVAILESEANSPAAQVADRHFGGNDGQVGQVANQGDSIDAIPDSVLVQQMAQLCKAVTLEFENVDSRLLQIASAWTQTRPNAAFLEICQDRKLEKEAVARLGCPTTPFRAVTNLQQAYDAARELGWPLVLKTARSGYDGKGQCLVRCEQDLPQAWESLQSTHAVAEQWIDFVGEVSMIAARNPSGQFVCYPLMENEHSRHILDLTVCPARGQLAQLHDEAELICRSIAEQYAVEGLFCVEFFVTRDGKILVNEIAPRAHNSGHLTIEAFDISQFEMQVRAVCNLPLRPPRQLFPAAMANLLGDLWESGTPDWSAILKRPQTFLHLYGKETARAGRKMGHLTVLSAEPFAGNRDTGNGDAGDGANQAAQLARQARELLTSHFSASK